MSAFYARLEATARRLIATYGKPAQIVTIARSGPAHAPVLTPTDNAAQIVETGYKLSLIPESLVQSGDRMGIISTSVGFSPTLDDRIKIDGAQYSFVDIKPLNPGGTTLLYEFLARK